MGLTKAMGRSALAIMTIPAVPRTQNETSPPQSPVGPSRRAPTRMLATSSARPIPNPNLPGWRLNPLVLLGSEGTNKAGTRSCRGAVSFTTLRSLSIHSQPGLLPSSFGASTMLLILDGIRMPRASESALDPVAESHEGLAYGPGHPQDERRNGNLPLRGHCLDVRVCREV